MDANKACSRKTCCSRHFQHAKADGPDNRPMYFLEIGKTGDQWLKCKDGFWVAHTKSCSLQRCTCYKHALNITLGGTPRMVIPHGVPATWGYSEDGKHLG